MRNLFIIAVFAMAFMSLTSCTTRLVDFTVISSKNVGMRAEGVATEGKCMKAFGIGANIKDAIDDALENAGTDYDLLVDGVLRYSNYTFVSGYKVEGKAVKSSDIKLAMGEDAYDFWYAEHVTYDANNPEMAEEVEVAK